MGNRLCTVCRGPFSPRIRPGQIYCSIACQRALIIAYAINEWLSCRSDASASGNQNRIARWARQHLLDTRGERCEVCGWAERNERTGRVALEFDHIDGDRTNNCHTNFRILCPNHHALTATWGYTGKTKRA